MPPTPSVPVPTPTQIVQLQLPQDVLKRLTPADPWISQPTATLLAAGIAVVAALIAFGGVWMQIDQARQRDEHRLRVETANSAAAAAANLMLAAMRMHSYYKLGGALGEQKHDFDKAILAVSEASRRVRMLDSAEQSAASRALEAYRDAAFSYAGRDDHHDEEVAKAQYASFSDADTAMTRALKEFSAPPPRRFRKNR